MPTFYWISLLACFSLTACFYRSANMGKATLAKEAIGYTFSEPAKVFDLPKQLVEVSGLSYRDDKLYTLNDEEGIIFTLDPSDGNILAKNEITGLGDYEGICSWADTTVIIKSKGHLIFYDESNKTTKKINTQLKSEHNVEGLCLDQSRKNLLIAGKGVPYNNAINQRAIYIYPLADLEQTDLAIFHMIHVDTLYAWYKHRYGLTSNIEQNQKIEKRIKSFAPSSIAIHPINHSIYISSSKGKFILMLDKDLNIQRIALLDKTVIEQPEGLCFSPSGTLFLSSEGKQNPGRIFVYEMELKHQ